MDSSSALGAESEYLRRMASAGAVGEVHAASSRWRAMSLILAAGAMCVQLGAGLIDGPWGETETAVMLLGVGVFALAMRGRMTVAAPAAIAFLLGLAALLELVSGWGNDTGFAWARGHDAFGMPPNDAFAVAFAGFNLMMAALASWQVARQCLWAAAAYLLMIGLIKGIAGGLADISWFDAEVFFPTGRESAAAMLLLGVSILVLLASGRSTYGEKPLIGGLLLSLALVFVLFNAALRVVAEHQRHFEQLSVTVAEQAGRGLERAIEKKAAQLGRLADRLGAQQALQPALQPAEEIERHLSLLLADEPSYKYLAVGLPGEEAVAQRAAAGVHVPRLPRLPAGVDSTLVQGDSLGTMSGAIAPILEIAVPLPSHDGIVAAGVDLERLAAEHVVVAGAHYAIEISHAEPDSKDGPRAWNGGAGWRVLARPVGVMPDTFGLDSTRLLLLAGMIAGGLFYAALRASMVARYRRLLLDREARRLRAAQEIGRLGHWDMDLRSGVVRWSDQAARLIGGGERGMPDSWESLLALAHGDDQSQLEAALEEMRSGGGWNGTFRLCPEGMPTRWIAMRAVPLPEAAGPRVDGSVQDVTEAVLRNLQLQHYARQLEQLAVMGRRITLALELPEIAATVARRSGEIIGAGQSGVFLFPDDGNAPCGTFVLSDGEASCRKQDIVFAESEVAALLSSTDTVTRMSRAQTSADPGLAARLAPEDGPPPAQGLLLAPIVGTRGRLAGVVYLSAKKDGEFTPDDEKIAQQVAVLVALAMENNELVGRVTRLNEELEERVAHRTELLRQTNEELEAFAYSVSHDLRAPLRAITGFVAILSSRYGAGLDEQGRHYLERVADGAGRLSRLIEDLLELSRVSRAEMRTRPLDLSTMARESLEQIAAVYPVAAQHAKVAAGLEACGDPRLVGIVLQNLLENACKYSSSSALPQVKLDCEKEDGRDVFCISDNGVGFDMAYADKLFGVFQRLHRDDEFPGTGIGLATVRRIILRHGGAIWCDAEPGRGARFYFTLGPMQKPAGGPSGDADE